MKMTAREVDTVCDICREGKARYDERVKGHTSHAYLCEKCHEDFGTGIGTILRRPSDEKVDGLEEPTLEELEAMMFDGLARAKCPHGCEVEPDGRCEHGNDSWLVVLGMI